MTGSAVGFNPFLRWFVPFLLYTCSIVSRHIKSNRLFFLKFLCCTCAVVDILLNEIWARLYPIGQFKLLNGVASFDNLSKPREKQHILFSILMVSNDKGNCAMTSSNIRLFFSFNKSFESWNDTEIRHALLCALHYKYPKTDYVPQIFFCIVHTKC